MPDARWRWDEIEAWFADGTQPDTQELRQLVLIVSVVNALLELRTLPVEADEAETVLPLARQVALLAGA